VPQQTKYGSPAERHASSFPHMPEPTTKIATSMPVYRVTFSMTVVVRRGSRERILSLAPGKILIPQSKVDTAGMIDATCNGHRMRLFQRDLMEKAERIYNWGQNRISSNNSSLRATGEVP
jgi:hypothetical protein